jgi:hypothetical protein
MNTNPQPSEQIDPAPDPVDVARDRTTELVNNMSRSALDQLRQMRDQADDLMRAITARDDAIKAQIVEQAVFVADAIAAKVIITDALLKLQGKFQPAPRGPTITMVKG